MCVFFLFPTCLSPAELARCRADLLSRRIALESRRSDVAEARQNCRNRRLLYSDQLVSAMRMGKCLVRWGPERYEVADMVLSACTC